ncbi:MAG: hypothetical protein QOJ56_2969 [Mycobacterium sp.]|jgi:hypothetical protein|nr:hypothetical protein [Mycobacterium sp.]MDT5354437.1 hypothetical protein [Mycobacterium sp.]
MMHLRSQFTYRLVTLYSSHKAFSLREPAKQTTRTGTKGVLGDQPIRNVAKRPTVATPPGDRQFLRPIRFAVLWAWP